MAVVIVTSELMNARHNPTHPAAAAAAAGSPAPHKKWIVQGAPPVAAGAQGITAGSTHSGPDGQPGGPRSKNLAKRLAGLLPHGSVAQAFTDYPALRAATVSYLTPDGNLVTLAGQQLTAPVTLDLITNGATSSQLSETAAGTQLVDVRKTRPAAAGPWAAQLVIARPGGLLLTLTEVSATPGAPIAGSVDTLTGAAKTLFDTPALDPLFS